MLQSKAGRRKHKYMPQYNRSGLELVFQIVSNPQWHLPLEPLEQVPHHSLPTLHYIVDF